MSDPLVPFFPPHLWEGSKDWSTDGPVRFLQRLLFTLNCADPDLKVTGIFDDATRRSVTILQKRLAMNEQEVEKDGGLGHCGPDAQKRLKLRQGMDLSAILTDGFNNECVCVGPRGKYPWPQMPRVAALVGMELEPA